jgi:amidase
MTTKTSFDLIDTTIQEIHQAISDRALTTRELVQGYIDRIDRHDRNGAKLNSIITVNPRALEEAERLDAAFDRGGLVGPLHGIPVVMKDQMDVEGLPTTLGSVLFRNYNPGADAHASDKLRRAGVVFLGKATLGELGGGDTHGSLFGSTRNVYDLERTAGGSSGGSAASVSANLCVAAVGQEGFSSIRRPSAWNGIAGMRPTVGMVSRSGVYGGWPTLNGSLGPMARTVEDLARLLAAMAGYDPADPVTARAVGRDMRFTEGLDPGALRGKRLGILRESVGHDSDPAAADFQALDRVFDQAVRELEAAGAVVVDPIVIPDLKRDLATRARDLDDDNQMFKTYFSHPSRPFDSRQAVMASEAFKQVHSTSQARFAAENSAEKHHVYMKARERLMTNLLKVMADHRLDAIVHKAVEHEPTLIRDAFLPAPVDTKGAIHINTFLMFVPSIVVPCGFTPNGLAAGITFLGRPYDDANMIRLAYAYERASQHRRVPELFL